MNYAQLGVFNTVTLGWVAGVHPSFSYCDEMKERLGTLMTGEYSNLQYALFPRSFYYIADKNKMQTTRGIAIQIMKSDNMSPVGQPKVKLTDVFRLGMINNVLVLDVKYKFAARVRNHATFRAIINTIPIRVAFINSLAHTRR
jgi:hypothetical protein